MTSNVHGEPTVRAIGLQKSFGPVGVLRGLDMQARAGETLTLFGPNGAGKTTLLRILATLTRPDGGTAFVGGFDTQAQGELVRRVTGSVLHSPMLYGDLTARENLSFFARMFRIPDAAHRVVEVSERMQITDRLDERARTLSHGFQKRVALARAILHAPRVLILDEPETGLDQSALKLLHDLVDDYRSNGGTVVMTTHALERGLEMGDRVAILARGKLVFEQERSRLDSNAVREAYKHYAGLESADGPRTDEDETGRSRHNQ
ncbi:MAG: heme ABC exporter ATP-binding protein CcmA [Dehalococcoidia bacterium]